MHKLRITPPTGLPGKLNAHRMMGLADVVFRFLAAPSDSQGTPPSAPLPLTFAGHELIASVFRSWPMCANLKFIRSAAKAANAAHAYNACWFWRSLLALPARSVRRLLHIGLRIVLGCWFTTECVPDADQPRVSSTRIYQ